MWGDNPCYLSTGLLPIYIIWPLPLVSSKSTGRHLVPIMDMKLAVLVLLACLVVVQCKITGNFKFNDRPCTYTEVRLKGHDRLLSIKCNKYKNEAPISCNYGGDPHPCHWYNQKNQPAYYKCLADKLAKDIVSPCNPASVVCKKHCEEITFNKEEEASNGKHESLVFERLRVFEEVEDDAENVYN